MSASGVPRIDYGIQSRTGPVTLPWTYQKQDACYARLNLPFESVCGLFIVADGAGGCKECEHVSRAAVDMLVQQLFDELNDQPETDIPETLTRGVQMANTSVFYNMTGATSSISGVAIAGHTAYLVHVGDTRIYQIDDQGIVQLTHDHSLAQRLVDRAILTPADMKKHPSRHILYRALGQSDSIDVDGLTKPFSTNITLLLCSDGLSDVLDDSMILETVHRFWRPQRVAAELVWAAVEYGSIDNITVIVVRIQG